MPNRKKIVNPIVTQRLNECIADSGKSGRWICKNVLKENDVEYSSSNFSKFTTGKTQPPDWIMQKLAAFFNVRLEWLYGIDDLKTERDQIANIVKHSFEILEKFNPEVQIHFEQLLKMYGYKICIGSNNNVPCYCISKSGKHICTLMYDHFAVTAKAIDLTIQNTLSNYLEFTGKTLEMFCEDPEKNKRKEDPQ